MAGLSTASVDALERVTRIHEAMTLPAPPPAAGEASGQLSPRLDRFLIGCVAENRAPFLRQAHLLVRSIRSFGGALADAAVMVCVVDEVDPHYRLLFEQEGANVRIVPRFDSRNPFANKLQFFPEAFGTGLKCSCSSIATPPSCAILCHSSA